MAQWYGGWGGGGGGRAKGKKKERERESVALSLSVCLCLSLSLCLYLCLSLSLSLSLSLVQLSRRSGRVTSGALWSSAVKGVGTGSTEKGGDADDTLEQLSARYMRLMAKSNNSATRLWTEEDVEIGLHTTKTATNHSTIVCVTIYRRDAAHVPPVPVSPDQPWWPYPSVMHCDYPWGQRDNARHSPYQNRVSNGL